MPYRWETFAIQPDFGLVENIAPLRQGIEMPGSAARLVNFEPSVDGGYRRINGYTKWDATEVTGTGQIFGVMFLEGSVIAVRNGNIYESTGSGWSAIATGRTHTTKHRYCHISLNGTKKLIGCDGVNYPYSWDGTNFVTINGTTDINGADHAIEFKDHVFYAKDDLVVFSVPFDETDFTVADGAGTFRTRDNVTGFSVFRERLYIFTETSIHVLDGDSQADWRLTSVTEELGCPYPDTIQEVAGDIAFLGPDGLRLLGATERDGDFSNLNCSRPIQKNFLDFKGRYNQFSSLVVRGKSQYRVFGFISGRGRMNSEGYLGTQFESQNPSSFRWAELIGMEVYASYSEEYNGEEYIFFVGEETGYVYRMESGDDFDGSDITSSYWTPYISFNDPSYRKTLYRIHAYYSPENSISGSLTINFDFNRSNKIQPSSISFVQAGGGALYGTAIFGTDVYKANDEDAIFQTNLIGSGETAQFRFDFDNSAPFILDSIMIEFATEERN